MKDVALFAAFLAVLTALAVPLGSYMARVFERQPTRLDPLLRPLERLIYRVSGVNEAEEMDWKRYAVALLMFNAFGMGVLYVIQRLQGWLPLNPQGFGAVPPDLAFNTAASFVTNTNWQAYAGESTMSYLTQMAGLTVQNFVSAATGMAVAVALIRGLVRRDTQALGNFWVDLTRSVLWVLLPLSCLVALFLVSQGVIQNLNPYVTVTTLEGAHQTIAMGPVASQEAIKLLGTNGGGFFGANASHPFENPNAYTNFVEMLSIILIPAALVFTFGAMTRARRQAWVIYGAMTLLFVVGLGTLYAVEHAGNPVVAAQGVIGPTAMEGKEVRFGIGGSSLFAAVTTAVACGAVNAMHDSLTPLGGLVPMFNIMLGEVVFGGAGAGLYGILAFVVVAVFIAGLMVGRTPEFLGKKIGPWEMKMATLAVLMPAVTILIGGAAAAALPAGRASVFNPGPHGLSEILYAFASAAGNNGSAFGGLAANTVFYNVALGLAMLIGRFAVIPPVLAMAGSLAAKRPVPPGPGTLPTDGALFSGFLVGVILLVGALNFFPALALGPVVEHLLLRAGRLF
ncbi:potassium-transporting ATPase subunit KdpA [Thermaerobacter sp. PB12/4term]|uniref:potassium-transporting ATPase subunit KdpA n=1 Tax=Thermaerobacter sp. PB12/4term TaxID=2293838 RepID=UPI000E328833|nr:potassium-transporting ATPase subunit KdpA [Thermaerobacter sp. PB12/4term]QIA27561.1 potassium-transporting ATPase subunit KdpA [Thermaerobacter sp. PB12/4term]